MEANKCKFSLKLRLIAGWKLLTRCILDDNSAEKAIFKQELQKRRRLKAKANILKQHSIRSLGRRAGCIKTDKSEIDVSELFKQTKNNFSNRKKDPFGDRNQILTNDKQFEGYNFSQVSTKFNRDSNSTERGKQPLQYCSHFLCVFNYS